MPLKKRVQTNDKIFLRSSKWKSKAPIKKKINMIKFRLCDLQSNMKRVQ